MAVKIYNVGVSNIKIREQGVFTAPELITDAGLYIESAGGYYAGANIIVGSKEYAIIIAPKELGETVLQWKTSTSVTSGANSTYDGKANMAAIEVAGLSIHPAAQYCANLDINGFNDWHLPAPDELEVGYRYLKPTTISNYTYSRPLHNAVNGTNPNSNPVGSGYTSGSPSLTGVSDFQSSGSQVFETTYYWTSMEYSSSNSWIQYFNYGTQTYGNKANSYRLRAVRWLEV